MQSVIYHRKLTGVFEQIFTLYSRISDTSESANSLKLPLLLDCRFKPLCDILRTKIANFPNVLYTNKELVYTINQELDNKIIVCVSGGKDSISTILYYLSCGYEVYLYHLKGINKVYFDEHLAVEKIAKYLNLPLYVDEIELRGNHQFVEHPMKNMIIANCALMYGIDHHITTSLAFGNFNTSSLESVPFEVCAGDTQEMWRAYEYIVRKFINNFTVHTPISNNKQTFEELCGNKELLCMAISCISPYRFREHWKKRTEAKYKIKLMDNRCGCCWKCCMEYMYYADKGVLEYHENYYLHCIEVLHYTIQKEYGISHKEISDVWNSYMFYSMEESKAKEKLRNAIIQRGKIKYTNKSVKR